ncbi:hypothetical protein KUCAC02_024077 [Chaenocephalus aceratus]|uniref:Uncharacterized protein n=1 Tax=Chaenocephalus aceratus TaxID=36190 RepID=A0ACB9WGQ8_CHAAC|nr:hypothetical protein KUCAC02_024077 [Chaenocephalus aceratus]
MEAESLSSVDECKVGIFTHHTACWDMGTDYSALNLDYLVLRRRAGPPAAVAVATVLLQELTRSCMS